MAGHNKVDRTEYQKRIYQVSLMLRRKSRPFILGYIRENWHLETAQADNYIRAARREWQKYFEKLKGDGIAYHVAQMRDLKDQAYSKKVVIGRGNDKKVITIANLGLVFEITKEEAKLMGIYPAEEHKLKFEGELKIINAKKKLISKLDSLAAKKRERRDIK